MEPVIELQNVTHVYSKGTPFEKTAIDRVSVRIERGQFVGLIGHTGSGKSTFIQHLNGLLRPDGGQVRFEGRDIHASKKSAHEIRFHVGLVFQYPEYQLFEETVYQDIAFGPKNMCLPADEIDRRVQEAAQFAGVPESLFSCSPLELSGGQKRRIAIAGVIAMRPDVLVLDEPTAGLDPAGCQSILENLCAYRAQTGSTVVLVSHSMDAVARIAERLIVFDQGHIVMDGTPDEVFSRPGELERIGLSVPAATKIAMCLRELGVPVPGSIYTTEQLTDALVALKGEADAC